MMDTPRLTASHLHAIHKPQVTYSLPLKPSTDGGQTVRPAPCTDTGAGRRNVPLVDR